MLDSKPVDKIIFLDIETTSQYASFKDMPENLKKLFKSRFKKEMAEIELDVPTEDLDVEYLYSSKAPLYAEWGRILCISFGFLKKGVDDTFDMTMVSCADDDEVKLLNSFIKKTESLNAKLVPEWYFAAHAGSLFDFPYIAKRMIINRLALPKLWDYTHLKPWETGYFIDTNSIWKHGVFDGGAASLDLLASLFGVPSSKGDMDGSMVKDVYYKEKDLPRIVRYCEEDVYALAQVYLRMKNMSNKINLITK